MYDVIIIGSGPAGLTAAIYTTRDNLKTLVLAGSKWGGQLMLTTLIENFPGFPEGIQGPDLMQLMRKQAERFGAQIINQDFIKADFASKPFRVSTAEENYEGKSIIIATGTDTQWLGVKGEAEKIGHGVSACAPCDAPFFKNKNVIVIGGGDAAMEEALVLANFVKEVIIIYRKDAFKRASGVMLERVKSKPKIKVIYNSEIIEILGKDKVEKVKLKDTVTAKISEMPIDGVFVAIRRTPNSKLFRGLPAGRQGIDVDEEGYIKVYDQIKTNIDGIFVAGDVHNKYYQQAITAAGFGAMAALQAERWLEDSK
ncbi:MAG: thioredoxin-disulfide reductase [Candidatus Levybacteria bacterium RIFCSPLOWO2_01_FULL_39_24]|nr:MAG: thioredoxin-disulfide reductase [Candidatus Levybacteria bacterium RIFCSPHIGHO2_01_FULL_40_16]OGH27806.1 MAG: thioredoxin-disulfide reductase [Candidatus Levybacteria bacterium RIFCSPHIGHO2_12_FULL_39_9]OGH46080.1 MAG: thioredoxin-disulfide reductase [Candidatus Levybacteria bacterium RIFCSPLOWO2_01_FULL_39_24]